MALNTLKCNHLVPLRFNGFNIHTPNVFYPCTMGALRACARYVSQEL